MKTIIHVYFISIFVFFLAVQVKAQTPVAKFSIQVSQEQSKLDFPISMLLENLNPEETKNLILQELKSGLAITIPSQISEGKPAKLFWIVEANGKVGIRNYQLIHAMSPAFDGLRIKKNDTALLLGNEDRIFLGYHYDFKKAPKGVDPSFGRSGFIHPLYTPHGQVLTRIQPEDHYHHYGIWNPWTHTVFEKDTIDFWNIGGKQGTVRFAKFLSQQSGPVFAEYKALHEHVVFKGRKKNKLKVALNEVQTVRVYRPNDANDYYFVDFTSEMSCATDKPFLIVSYRYAGLGWRATELWDRNNCEVFTSENKNRDNADNTKAKWIAVQGILKDEFGGAVLLSHPENYNHPEPLRIWDKDANAGRGDMFANFSPTKDKDWLLKPGKTYVLKYRFVVFNGKFDASKAEVAWKSFAESVKPTMKN